MGDGQGGRNGNRLCAGQFLLFFPSSVISPSSSSSPTSHIVAQIRLFHWQWIDQFLSFKSIFIPFLCHYPSTTVNPFRPIFYLIFVQKYQFPSLRNCCWPSVFFMPFYKGEYNKRKEGRRALALA
jgi:hypothetical protein